MTAIAPVPVTDARIARVQQFARLLDTAFRIPGTRIRFGLDPLLGLLPGLGDAIAALFGWVQVCLLVRAQVKAFREKEFVRAAQALGASPWYIIRRHLIPNSISPIIVGFVLAIPLAMMLEASLSFLGIGVPPPTATWGQMINEGINFMFYYWHLAVFPTAALARFEFRGTWRDLAPGGAHLTHFVRPKDLTPS